VPSQIARTLTRRLKALPADAEHAVGTTGDSLRLAGEYRYREREHISAQVLVEVVGQPDDRAEPAGPIEPDGDGTRQPIGFVCGISTTCASATSARADIRKNGVACCRTAVVFDNGILS
jgi:hypothetical protein